MRAIHANSCARDTAKRAETLLAADQHRRTVVVAILEGMVSGGVEAGQQFLIKLITRLTQARVVCVDARLSIGSLELEAARCLADGGCCPYVSAPLVRLARDVLARHHCVSFKGLSAFLAPLASHKHLGPRRRLPRNDSWLVAKRVDNKCPRYGILGTWIPSTG